LSEIGIRGDLRDVCEAVSTVRYALSAPTYDIYLHNWEILLTQDLLKTEPCVKADPVKLLGSKSTDTMYKLALVVLSAKETSPPGRCHHADGLDPYQ